MVYEISETPPVKKKNHSDSTLLDIFPLQDKYHIHVFVDK